ncbi:hypothetical protein PoB_002362200 [Plakobranchus ocellatus]|uniref:Uncharacterized protein n=1 Tax=Plakobranchus ocellatus TaxID=259542 RepID=A0AAV3ZRH6_9GAST|nr:hypothetical protein PoB_002362200 [Plakobranchus ocellatus]
MDISPSDRLTRKRNMLLQKQLDVQLQIIREEYRMTRKDLDKGSKTLAEFLLCLRHTAPGLHTYGQPDTRAMNAKSILLERRYEQECGDVAASGKDGMSSQAIHPSVKDKTKKRPQSSKEPMRRAGSAKEREDQRGEEKEENGERQKPSSASAYRNEFFNRRIVLDSKRRSFLQHALEKNGGGTKGVSDSDTPKPLTRAATHSGFYSNRDTRGEMNTRPKSSTTPRTDRPATPKYGRDAETQRNEDSRKNVLKLFEVIFDPARETPNGKIRPAGTTATPLIVPKDSDSLPLQESNPSTRAMAMSPRGATPYRNGYLLNRRVAWSAPPKRREDPSAGTVTDSSSSHPNRESQSVTPRSGTQHLAVSTEAQRPRPKSHIPKTSKNLHTSSPSDTLGLLSPRFSPRPHEQNGQGQIPSQPPRQNHEHSVSNPNHKDSRVFTRRVVTQQELDMRAQRQRALGKIMTTVGATGKRPKTAPQPNYELMRRSVAAPRQQVAGILAEIQSRRADTRAMLTKSKQIKQLVQTLVPDEMLPDDSLSD